MVECRDHRRRGDISDNPQAVENDKEIQITMKIYDPSNPEEVKA
jgi:hypothetical protein